MENFPISSHRRVDIGGIYPVYVGTYCSLSEINGIDQNPPHDFYLGMSLLSTPEYLSLIQ